jgi:hypothetical protein
MREPVKRYRLTAYGRGEDRIRTQWIRTLALLLALLLAGCGSSEGVIAVRPSLIVP